MCMQKLQLKLINVASNHHWEKLLKNMTKLNKIIYYPFSFIGIEIKYKVVVHVAMQLGHPIILELPFTLYNRIDRGDAIQNQPYLNDSARGEIEREEPPLYCSRILSFSELPKIPVKEQVSSSASKPSSEKNNLIRAALSRKYTESNDPNLPSYYETVSHKDEYIALRASKIDLNTVSVNLSNSIILDNSLSTEK